MSIRNAAKAIILSENRILLNKCNSPHIGEYYALPGGGQNQYETMEQAVVRECLEETGYTVVPVDLAALYEEIYTSEAFRQKHPDYSHKILHIFRCTLSDVPRVTPIEPDSSQTGCVWVDVGDMEALRLLPECVGRNIRLLIDSSPPMYLGTHRI